MGFMDALKNATSNFVKSIRHKEFKLRAGELAEKWNVLSRYRPEIKIRTGNQDWWWEISRVYVAEKEVGLIRRSKVKRVFIEYIERYEDYYDEDEEEERGWFDYRRESDIVKMDKDPNDKVEIRLTLANYEKMLEKEGEILK